MTEKHPVVDLSLFRRRNFALGTLAFSLGYAVFFANILLFPLWLQTQLGYTATWAGLVAAPAGVSRRDPDAGRGARDVTLRHALGGNSIAFVAFALSFFMRAELTADASFGAFVLPLLVQGVAMSTFFVCHDRDLDSMASSHTAFRLLPASPISPASRPAVSPPRS